MDPGIPNFRPDLQLQPGRYRIISEIAGTVIQISEHDYNKVVTWEKHGGDNQQWFVQRSGGGYKFKNCQHGNYLAVPSTDQSTLLHAGRFPMTWVLLKLADSYMLQYPGNNRLMDLHNGWKTNGNEIHICQPGNNHYKTWRFERISDDTGEELTEAFRKEVDRLKQDLAQKDQQLAEKNTLLSRQEATISQLNLDFKSKLEELARAHQCDNEILQLHKQQAELKDELSQQKAETASLQGKMDRIESFMAEMRQKDEQRFTNVP